VAPKASLATANRLWASISGKNGKAMMINIIVHSQFKILVAALAVALHRSVQSTFSLHQEAFIIRTSLNLALAITLTDKRCQWECQKYDIVLVACSICKTYKNAQIDQVTDLTLRANLVSVDGSLFLRTRNVPSAVGSSNDLASERLTAPKYL